jgi:NADPH-dependent 2,4-dienoyl-CoA reductase/sulfur reductase-like enzyme/peroxiredoxin family protein/TusA-related sulfurtransferase/rhodanese-related sulfurtransferase
MSKTVIIGGVAGGASCAARLRRLDETAEIVMFERGKYISYANCGLPYRVGNVIRSRDALLLQTPERMKERFRVDVRVEHEVKAIDRANKTVSVLDKTTGQTFEESYDQLVISTGSSPLRPPIPGIDSDRIRTLWTVPDTDGICSLIEQGIHSVTVVGGGFIGLEMAENLHAAGLAVTIVEALDQVMAPLDPEMAALLHGNIRENGVQLRLSDGVESFEEADGRVITHLKSGAAIPGDLVILSIGVRPNSLLAKEAGLTLNQRGGIVVDDHLRTEDPSIYAVGDVIEVTDPIFGDKTMIPLAGPANKQGRIAADNIAGGDEVYEGTQGSAVAKVFDLTAASTGFNEKMLVKRGMERGKDYETVTISQGSHAGYYPCSTPMMLKLLFTTGEGRLLGAQIVGRDGVDKRIDTIGTALRLKGTVRDLKNLELAYAPPYSSAKDPVNMAGFTAENVLRGLVSFAGWQDVQTHKDAVLLDVREEPEVTAWALSGAVNIPLGSLRDRLSELDKDKETIVFCAIGVRAYNAARILMQNGFTNVRIFPGGARFYRELFDTPEENNDPACCIPCSSIGSGSASPSVQNGSGERIVEGSMTNPSRPAADMKRITINCSGLQCPGPIMEVFKNISGMKEGELLEVTASDPGFAKDIVSWCRRTGNTLISNEEKSGSYVAVVQKGMGQAAPQKAAAPAAAAPEGKTIIVFDGDMDKVLASFVIANGALAMGRPVTMFFTFWGLNALRKDRYVPLKKTPVEKMFGAMLPRGTRRLKLSKMNMGGMGTAMMRRIMKDKNIDSLEDMMKKAMAAGVKIIACSMSMDVMGIRKEELIDGVEIGGVGTYLGDAEESNVNLFI